MLANNSDKVSVDNHNADNDDIVSTMTTTFSPLNTENKNLNL